MIIPLFYYIVCMVKFMEKDNFKEYYYKYLSYNENQNILCSENRDKVMNIYKYPIIVALYEGKKIYSVSQKYFSDLEANLHKKQLINETEITSFLKDFFADKDVKISIQEMIRMTKVCKGDIDISYVKNIDETYREKFYNSFDKCNDLKYKELKWNVISKFQYLNGIIEDNKIVSMGYVSNIDYNHANIVIETKKGYRNKRIW